jgi:Emfourin
VEAWPLNEEVRVRIEFKTEGGLSYFPGLSKPRVIDSGQLPEAEATELEQLVHAVGFFELPTELGKGKPGAADYHRYVVTIEDERRRHTVRVIDPIEDPKIASLIEYLQKIKLPRGGNKSL